MIIRTLVLTTLLVSGSAAYAAESVRYSDPKSVKIEKEKDMDKDKEKGKLVVSVPDGDPSTALLLTIGAVGVGVFGLRRRTPQNS